MPTATGTSALGLQNLLTGATAPNQDMSIIIPSRPLPPVRRYGYFYLYQYLNVAPFQCFIVREGLIRSPGLYISDLQPLFAPAALLRLDAIWSLPGIGWSATLNSVFHSFRSRSLQMTQKKGL